MKKIKKENNFEIIALTLISILSVMFWNTSIVYPIKIFVVLLHEISHALMTILSGGTVTFIKLDSSLAGLTLAKGGNPILIAASGYLGSLFFGSLLFLSAKHVKFRLWYTSVLALVLFLSAVNLIKGEFVIFFTLIISVLFFITPRYFNEKINNISIIIYWFN